MGNRFAEEANVDVGRDGAAERTRRRRRLTAEQVRKKMLNAAHDIVVETGITLSLEDVSLEDVMRRADVPRSSVYRIWPYKGDFVDDLLCHMAGPDWYGTATFDPTSIALAEEIVTSNTYRLATDEGRWQVIRETVRQAVATNFANIVASAEWQIYLAIVTTARTTRNPHLRARIAEALNASETRFVSNMVGFYTRMADLVGIRLKDGIQFEHLTLAGSSILEGLAYRAIIGELISNRARPAGSAVGPDIFGLIHDPLDGPGLDNETAAWSFAATAYLAVLEGFVELDPGYRMAAPNRETHGADR